MTQVQDESGSARAGRSRLDQRETTRYLSIDGVRIMIEKTGSKREISKSYQEVKTQEG